MADGLFAIRAGDRLFTLDKLTLGDFSMFKREFNLKAEDIFTDVINAEGETIQTVNIGDFDVLIALLVAVLRRERPTAAVSVLRAEIESLDISDLAIPNQDTEDEEEEDPTLAVDEEDEAEDSEEIASPAKAGSSAKSRKKPGRQS